VTDEVPRRFEREILSNPTPMRAAWEASARDFIAWVQAPDHDSYWLYHRDLFLALLPPPGRLTLDIGCGEGRLSRDLKALGHAVVGIDASPTMVRHARDADTSIEVHLADAAELPLPNSLADLAVAFMSLQDMDNASGAIREAARVLEPDGRFCLAIVHPFASAGMFESYEADAPFVIHESYLARHRYRDTIERDGFKVTFDSEHRPVGWYFDALESAGLLVERLREVPIPEEAIAAPRNRRWQRLPLFLHIRAQRP
jgi:SAM-dependent methyltransferase